MEAEGKQSKPKHLGSRVGRVSSTGGQKTIHVVVENLVRHPRYHKYVRRRAKLAVHDPREAAGLGDMVEVAPCRPISKTKSWRLVRVVRRSSAPAETTRED
jgi:small subunit ribosomal protein S17